ncbi:hypothetical protein OIO90_003152 [Microbotryomycetes sp. JL221]|nr:hypothetical protein OIO90_003152 [Microbotryomycetes sp. JL221]
MAPSKRKTTAKQSAHSKRHKPGTGGSTHKQSTTIGATKKRSTKATPRSTSSSSTFATTSNGFNTNGLKSDKTHLTKDKKGKAPAFIRPVPSSQPRRHKRTSHDEEDDQDEHDDDDSDNQSIDQDDDGGMQIDDELDTLDRAQFLTKLDHKGMSASRPSLVEAYRKEKPAPQPRTTKSSSILSRIPLPEPKPLKSELKALKKQEALKKKRRKQGLNSDSEQDEHIEQEEFETVSQPHSQRKQHPEGELLSDLESDDLAFGSGDSDSDELSVMSDFEADDQPMSDLSDDESELPSDFDEDDEELEDDEIFDDESKEPLFDDDEELHYGSNSDEEESVEENDDDQDESQIQPRHKRKSDMSDEDDDQIEAMYEQRPSKPKPMKQRPLKLPVIENGKVIRATSPIDRSPSPDVESQDEDEQEEFEKRKRLALASEYRSDPLGQRFGRPAVRTLLEIRNKRERLQRVREEIADLGREASGTGEGEGGLNLIKRLLALTAPKFSSSSSARHAGEKPITVDREIRILAMVSLLAVFNDVVPGYRIRPLTDVEKETKVSQQVARQREWEEGLVTTYKRYLELCEAEVEQDSALASAAIHCLCTLVKEKSEFNFAVNIMDVVVKRLGRKGWDEVHQTCLETINHIFIHDTSTTASNSLHLVRLVSRLVRARSFAIRPEVLTCLLNLRLKDELGGGRVRASTEAVFREQTSSRGSTKWNKEKNHRGRKGGKAKIAMDKKGSKKTRQALKEQDKIDKELREAEGEINREERERNMTETLKLLFALYFRIVKLDYKSPLLPAALEGLARFAHLVNIDFFRDLLEVLKVIIKRGQQVDDDQDVGLDVDDPVTDSQIKRNDMREKLLCIVTAFELLQGQGEALNIDLTDFVSALYAVILPLSLSPTFEEVPYLGRNAIAYSNRVLNKLAQTEADLLFRALTAVFLTPRSLPSSTRILAFSKRLLTASLNWPSSSQLRTLVFLRSLLLREPKLETMLETGDRRIDGKWRPTVDEPERAEPESTCWWEGSIYYKNHPDDKVRQEAKKLLNYQRD